MIRAVTASHHQRALRAAALRKLAEGYRSRAQHPATHEDAVVVDQLAACASGAASLADAIESGRVAFLTDDADPSLPCTN